MILMEETFHGWSESFILILAGLRGTGTWSIFNKSPVYHRADTHSHTDAI